MKKINKESRARKATVETIAERETIGIDISDKVSSFCRLSEDGEIAEEGRFRTTPEMVSKRFGQIPAARIALEAGTHSAWMAHLLRSIGHEVYVANPRDLKAVTGNKRKSDREDALQLARLARADFRLLKPTYVRSLEVQQDAISLMTRDGFVRARSLLVNLARSLAKTQGQRLPKTITKTFGKRAFEKLPAALGGSMELLLKVIDALSVAVEDATEAVEEVLETKYAEAKHLTEVSGVGAVTTLSYVVTLESPDRFPRSRDVGPYVGLTTARRQSGERDPQLGISKAGNSMLRRLLVQCAHHILGHCGKDSALRRWGLKLAGRNEPNARKRAVVAVARKLAVLLHRLWKTGEHYLPFPGSAEQAAVA